jgi:hypothetical protein
MKRFFSKSIILIIMMAVIFLGNITANAFTDILWLEPSGNHSFGAVAIPYNVPEEYIVIATYTPGAVMTASLLGDNPDSFTLSTEHVPVPAIQTAIKLTIVPKAGLPPGTHTATVIIAASDGSGNILKSESFDVIFTITIGVGTDILWFEQSGNHNFGVVAIPYNVPEAYIVAAVYMSNVTMAASLLGDNHDSFTLSTELLPVPAISTGIKLTIVPKAGLSPGTHMAAVRSEERRVGKECRYACRSRWSPYH